MNQDLFPVWINGTAESCVPASDRGLAYGDGVFETLRLQPQPVLSDYHWERLERGLVTLGIPVDVDAVRADVDRYIAANSPALLKVIITRGSGGRGYLPPDDPTPLSIIQGFPLPHYDSAWYDSGIALYLCKTPLSCHPVLSGIKHLNRLEQVLGRQEFAGKAFQEGLMADQNGGWLEGTMSSLFLVSKETLCMPALATQSVQGTMQRFLVSCCREENIPFKEVGTVTDDQLMGADRVFMCNSVFGLWPVQRIMDKPLSPKPSPLFDYLKRRVMSLIS